MRWKLLLLCALALQPLGVTPAQAENVRSEFVKAWTEREGQYANQAEAANAHQQAAIQTLAEVSQPNAPDAEPKLKAVLDAASGYGFLNGRRAAIGGFRAFFASKPSQARTEMWMQEQVNYLQGLSRKADSDFNAVRALKPAETPDYLMTVLKAIAMNGLVRGATEETQLIDQNLAVFFQAKTADDARRRQARAAFFGALGASLQQSAQLPAFQPTRNVRCTTFGNTTNCSGN